MANGWCRQHGGKTVSSRHCKHPHINQIVRAGHYGANGCALNDAVVAYRTQQRLERLVEAVSQRSELDPDQGVPGSTEPSPDPCVPSI
jgi:hypothetical protein